MMTTTLHKTINDVKRHEKNVTFPPTLTMPRDRRRYRHNYRRQSRSALAARGDVEIWQRPDPKPDANRECFHISDDNIMSVMKPEVECMSR